MKKSALSPIARAQRDAARSRVKLSETSKLGCMSWSLIARDTCPGSIGDDGGLVPACAGCYAAAGNYRYPNVRAPREFNRADWQRAEWVADMVGALIGETYFRWFDSGDVYAVALAEKIADVMEQTPWVAHWLPTRMLKFAKFAPIFARMRALPNVSVRFSSDSVTGQFGAEHGSTIIPAPDAAPPGVTVCGAYARDGKCGDCRACWNPSVAVIAYPAHGRGMARVVRIAVAAGA
jgi:hypothetical protein